MRAQTSNPQLDDEGGQRESEVRHAHAVAASRHGRASAPGYLGIPVDDGDGEDTDDRDEASGSDEPRGAGRRRSARTRAQGGARNGDGRQARNGNGGHRARNGNGGEQSRRSPGRRGSGPKRTSKRGSPAAKQAAKPRASRTAKATASKAGGAAGASKQTSRKVTQTAERAAKGTAGAARKVASATSSSRGGVRGLAAKELRRIVRHIAKEALVMSGGAAAKAVRQVGETGIDAVAERVNRVPIQRSVDVAVPVEVAWAQWMELRHLPEGAKRVKDVEREGETLHGQIDGVGHEEWEAEVIDERENESFAWRSTQGSDSAGLVTFHELSERLTRIELELDVRPVHLVEAATLALHIADRRADSQLRRFKAEAELINPDCYEDLLSSDGSISEGDEDS